MKTNILILIVVSLTSPPLLFAQSRLSYGIETGINSSGIPYFKNKTVGIRNEKVKETNMPVISPTIGLWTTVNIGKYFYCNLGIQYLKVGNRYRRHRIGNDVLGIETYSFYEWENQIFNRISMPLSFAYKLKIRNFKSNIFIGIRASYYAKGIYHNEIVNYKKNNASDIVRIQELNPFDKTDFTITAKKWNYGILSGINFGITKKFNFEMTCSLDQIILYGNTFGDEGSFNTYNNNDFAMTIKYRLNK